MSTSTITSKGQITLPRSVRTRLRLGSGDRVEFIESAEGFLLVPAKHDIKSLKGVLPKPAKPVSIKQMNQVIAKMGR